MVYAISRMEVGWDALLRFLYEDERLYCTFTGNTNDFLVPP